MTKLIRNTSTPEAAKFWEYVKRTADEAKDYPDWMRAGIVLNDRNFVTYAAEPAADEQATRAEPMKTTR